MPRASLHNEPHRAVGIARHHIRPAGSLVAHGLECLLLGGVVAVTAYGARALVAAVVGDPIL